MKVFISYQHEDVQFASELSTALERHGFGTWFSQKPEVGLKREEDWRKRSKQELDTSAVMLFVLSDKSVRPESMVHVEYALAVDSKVRVIPVRIAPVDAPFPLSDLQTIDFVGRFYDALQELVMVLQTDPYAARGMIRNPSQFFGREKELREVFSRLATMQSVSVVGERRIGKSSFLYHIYQTSRERLGTSFICHYLDLQRVLSAKEFYQRACELLGVFGNTHRNFERALGGKQVILCLDEFEQVTSNPGFDADFFNVLRSLMQTDNLALIAATQHTLSDLYRADAIPTSPFPNIFTLLRLGQLTEAEARELVTRPAEHIGKAFTDDEVNFILGLAGLHPYRLNVASALLYEAKLGGRVNFTEVRRRFEEEAGNGKPLRALRAPEPTADKWTGTIWAGVLALGSLIITWLSAQMGNLLGFVLSIGLGVIAVWLFVVDSVPTLRSRGGTR